MSQPLPDWPGQLIPLGHGHQVYVRTAPGDGEPALFVHGLGGSSRNWTDLMDLLRPSLACDALDLPGFGDSPPRPDGRYSVAALAETISALIEQRGNGPVHLIASSLGGTVAVKLAAARPDLTRTLTLISPALPDTRLHRDQFWFPLVSLPRIGPRLLRRYDVQPPQARVADVIGSCFADPALFPPERFAAEVAELSRRDTLDYAPAAVAGTIQALTAEFVRRTGWRDAARITAPALVIYGRQDRVVDPRMAGRAAHAFAAARVVVLPRTGHLAHMEHPALVAAEIGVLLGAREFPLTPAS